MARRTSSQSAIAFLSGICLLAGSAIGQDALGNGDALDASPSTRGRLNTQRPSFASELQFRNAIATGNAPGGLSFRGDLGYRAAGEFSGVLGSDTLFSFRRDSLYSGLAGMGIRGTEAVQYQFALTTGGRPPSDLMGNLAVSRDFGARTGTASGMSAEPISTNTDITRLDPRGQSLSTIPLDSDEGSMLGTLRSSASYLASEGMQPMLLSVYTQGIEQTPYALVASNLRGIAVTPLHSNTGINQPGAKTDDEDGAPKTLTTMNDLFQEQRDRAIEMSREGSAAGGESQKPVNEDWFTERMQEIRDELYGVPKSEDPTTDPSTDPENSEAEEGIANPITGNIEIPDPTGGSNSADLLEQMEADELKELEKQDALDSIELSPELLSVLRGEKPPVDRFIGQNASSSDVYAEHIRFGERLIRSERYFDAEERFTRALAIRPGDVTAQIGRIHAQIGAGMVLSGSVNLQSILTDAPQLAGTRYSQKLLPSSERTRFLIDGLRLRAGLVVGEDRPLRDDRRVRISSGLLLAYIGYQTLDADAVADGLKVMKEEGSEADQRLARLLEQIWDVSLELLKAESAPINPEK